VSKLIVSNIEGLDGTYEFEDLSSLSNRELHRIKTLTGLRLGEFTDALAAGDNDLLVGLSVILLERIGKTVDEDLLWEAPGGSLVLDFSEDEDPTQAEARPAADDSPVRPGSEPRLTGESSSDASETLPENGQSPTGPLDLETSAVFDPVT